MEMAWGGQVPAVCPARSGRCGYLLPPSHLPDGDTEAREKQACLQPPNWGLGWLQPHCPLSLPHKEQVKKYFLWTLENSSTVLSIGSHT